MQHRTSFLLTVYKGREAAGDEEWSEKGEGADWQRLDALRLPGFDGRVNLPLAGFWQAALTAQSPRFEQQIEGLETIVKLSDTMQLRTTYTVVLGASFS